MARVGVVIPAYNAARFLGETLRSALASTYRDFEIVVIDDGSTDQTAEIAESFGAPVRVLSQPNAGMSASRNRGVDAMDSEFVALLDSDDVWHPEKLRLQVKALEEDAVAGFCYTAFSVWYGAPWASFAAEPRSGHLDPNLSGWIYHELILDNWSLPSSVLFRRSAWEQLGPFLCENQKTDDWEYLVRASTKFRFLRLAEEFVLYRQFAQSLSRRIPGENSPEMMREALIGRFGLRSPDGKPVDAARLARHRHLGWCNFADLHCSQGDLALGLRTFGNLVLTGPYRLNSLEKMGKALFRRVFPKREQAEQV